jgi:hypothetical protein
MASNNNPMSPQPASCRCCGNGTMTTLYTGPADMSLTTMTTVLRGQTLVRSCNRCAHCQTDVLTDLDHYYSHEYELGRLNEEDDQLYSIQDGVPVFRAQHQARVFANIQTISPTSAILDYGAGKSLTIKRLVNDHPGLKPFVYDVSSKYKPVWETFTEPSRCLGEHDLTRHRNAFDVVTLFFVLEHVTALDAVLSDVHSLLKPGGYLHAVVPNPLVNVADLIVADHVNHFSQSGLLAALHRHGFHEPTIDASSHFGALIVRATRVNQTDLHSSPVLPDPESVSSNLASLGEIAVFWNRIKTALCTTFDVAKPEDRIAVYGAGFYGAYVRLLLAEQRIPVAQIVDRNPHLQGTTVDGIPVVAIEKLRPDISTVIVALNPSVARSAVANLDAWKTRTLRYVYLD